MAPMLIPRRGVVNTGPASAACAARGGTPRAAMKARMRRDLFLGTSFPVTLRSCPGFRQGVYLGDA